MPHNRFYINAPLKGRIFLYGDEYRHLSRIMRKKEGDIVELINGQNVLAIGKVVRTGSSGALIDIVKVKGGKTCLPPLILIQALPKPSLLEWIIQKGTELGVSQFYLYVSTLSEQREPSSMQMKRYHNILIASIKQCGRTDIPTINIGFPELTVPLFFGDLSTEAPLLFTKATLPAALVIGPERGFTAKELERLRQKGEGVSLSPYILRADTAAIAALSILVNSASSQESQAENL